MDNFNGQNQVSNDLNGQNQFQQTTNGHNQFDPNLQNMQMMQPNMYQQPTMYQQPNMYQQPKSSAWKWILIIILIIAVVFGAGACAITACVGVTVGSSVAEYTDKNKEFIDKTKYSKDINALDCVNTAVKTFVADPSTSYGSNNEYVLSELMSASHDPEGIIKSILAEFIDEDGEIYICSSKAFEGTTIDDIRVHIKDGAVSIYVPVNEKYSDDYDSYVVGQYYSDKK